MNTARLYDTPEQFAEMMKQQLSKGLGVGVEQSKEETLLLMISLNPDNLEERLQVSLHDVYRTYATTGDLNAAVDQLNGIVRASMFARIQGRNIKIDADFLFPAIRDERYVTEAGRDMDFVSEPFWPGLRIIFLEIKDGVTKIVNRSLLEQNPRFTEAKVKKLAYANLREAGWQAPSMRLNSPARTSCTFDIYMDYSHPVECQFSQPIWASNRMPGSYVIAYTNRRCTLVMRSTEPMNTPEQALRLARQSKFMDTVKRSFMVMPNPVSDRLYWVHHGEVEPLF